MKYPEWGSTGAAEQGGLKVEAIEAVTRRRRNKRSSMRASNEQRQQRSGLDRSPMMIWTRSIRRRRSGLDRSDLCLLAWGSSGVALALKDWGIALFRFALGFFFFFGESVGTSVICWLLGLPWAWLYFIYIYIFFFFFFFFLLESRANKFFY